MNKTISQLVAAVESNSVPWVMRYEPNFKPTQQAINNCIAAHKPGFTNRTTAETICRTSFGSYQIMGENIYTVCGFKSNISEFLYSDSAQLECFEKFIKARGINFSAQEILSDVDKRNLFSRRYNGSTAYSAKLVAAAGG